MDVTVTPADYSMPRCAFDADYSNHLMFTMEAGDNNEIFIMGADGSGLCRLTDNLIEEGQVDWSPDRKQIAFVSQRGGDGATDIYVMNFDGTNMINLTQDQRMDFDPVWSPDGTRLAYDSQDPSGPGKEIYVVNADGSDIRDLTPGALGARAPSWSPDGTRIAYSASSQTDPNNAQIYAVEVSTGKIETLSNASIGASDPSWSPDESILYITTNTLLRSATFYGPQYFTLNTTDQSVQPFGAIPFSYAGLGFSPQGDEIAYANDDQIKILDRSGVETRAFTLNHPNISRVSWR